MIQKQKKQPKVALCVAPPAGLEPATYGLTVRRSTDWAMREYQYVAISGFEPESSERRHSDMLSITPYCVRTFIPSYLSYAYSCIPTLAPY